MFHKLFVLEVLTLLLLARPLAGAQPVTAELPLARPMVVVFAPDGAQLAIGGLETVGDVPQDGLVILLDAKSGKQRATLRHSGTLKDEHGSVSLQNRIRDLAYSPDGRVLAVATDFGLKLWNASSGQEIATLLGYGTDEKDRTVEVASVAFSPNGKWLAVSPLRWPSKIEMWDVERRQRVRQIELNSDGDIAFSQDGSLLASAGGDNRVYLWNPADGQVLAEIHAEMGILHGVAIDPAEKLLAVASEGFVKVWRINRDDAGGWRFADVFLLNPHSVDPSRRVAFSPDGKFLATSGDGVVQLYDANSRKEVASLLRGGPFAFSPDGRRLAVAEQLWNQKLGGASGCQFEIWPIDRVLDAARLADQARTAADELVRALAAGGPVHRIIPRALAVLSGPQSADAAPVLIAALENPQIKEKTRIVIALGRIGVQGASVAPTLIKLLRNHSEANVRNAAADALGQLTPNAAKDAVEPLFKATLHDETPQVRVAAAGALRNLDPATYQRAVAAASARGPVVDKVVKRDGKLFYQGRSLDEWIERLSVSYVPNEIFGRPSPDEPLAAVRAMGADAVPVLVDTLKSDQWQLRRAAAAGLKALGPKAADAIEPLIETISTAQSDQLDDAAAAADAVAVILRGAKAPPTRLVELLKSENPAVRLGSARAVAQLPPDHSSALKTLKAAYAAAQSRTSAVGHFFVPPIIPRPSLQWMTKTIADPKAPRNMRMRVAAALGKMGEDALPALPSMLKAVEADSDVLSNEVVRAIQLVGPKGIPAVRDAMNASTSRRTRQRLAPVLAGMGDDGRRALQDVWHGEVGEALWWSATLGGLDPLTVRRFQAAAEDALRKLGEPVPPSSPVPRAAGFMPQLPGLETPSVAWLIKVLVDPEAPRQIRFEAANKLARTPPEQILPKLPELLTAIREEKDMAISFQIENVIRRLGAPAVPAVRDAIDKLPTASLRRRMLLVLNSLGAEGRRTFGELVQNDPELRALVNRAMESGSIPESSASRPSSPPVGKHNARPGQSPKLSDAGQIRRMKVGKGPEFEVHLQGTNGQEIKGRVDTGSDAFIIASWTDPTNKTWTPRAKELPMTLYAYTATGEPHDVPADWNGQISGWAFVLPIERDTISVSWNEGTPAEVWKGASFGWGGLRNSLNKVVVGRGQSDESKRFRYVPSGKAMSEIRFDTVIIKPARSPDTEARHAER